MKLRFDPDQDFQKDAIASVVDIFDGQPRTSPTFSVIDSRVSLSEFETGQRQREHGVGNQIIFPDRLYGNVRTIQTRNRIDVPNPDAPLDAWTFTDPLTNVERDCPHFTVEMETGTGKTYVYLRTIYELSTRYGFRKFIIVVPSVAIREGVLKSIEITTDHFRGLYDNHPVESFVYDAQRVNRLRHFATSHSLQVMVMNIQTFNKQFAGEDEKGSNVIYRRTDRLNDRKPIDFVQAARPIVIIDEPQSVDSTEKAQEAIRALNPLCTMRYSATHLHRYNLVYQLDPIRAFESGLVKQIVVASATSEAAANDAFVKVLAIEHHPKLRAKLRIHKQAKDGPNEASITVEHGDDLWKVSNKRLNYKTGFEVTEISAEPDNKYIQFSNGTTLTEGQEVGGLQSDVWRAQIKHTIKKHLEKELQVKDRGIKVLSLFFVDKVANYRDYDEHGKPAKGLFATMFEEEFAALVAEPRFKELPTGQADVASLHNGYFAQDKRGRVKDTSGATQADDDAYSLIMREKERLLDPEEPLRFIFSHSALREGWDNPNVFQICTLNETKSRMKKRQEIGRGLRLPVNQDGERVKDRAINRLYVMANESYEDFARALQTEYEEDCGVVFGRLPLAVLEDLVLPGNAPDRPIGTAQATIIRQALRDRGFIDDEGRILDTFKPSQDGFTLNLPREFVDLEPLIIDAMSEHRLERHVQQEKDSGPNSLRKQVYLDAEFKALWDRIKLRTTYRVEFDTEDLVKRCVKTIAGMPPIDKPRIRVEAASIEATEIGVMRERISLAEEVVNYDRRPVPDLLAYLQAETELTRQTLVRILTGSGRLRDVFNNPQRFLDEVSRIMRAELSSTVVDGVKYEPLMINGSTAEWEMRQFEQGDGDVVDYLKALRTNKTPYEYTLFDSEVERRFAKALDKREDIRLFVKLPLWFKVQTPVGDYNPDWAIVKDDDKLYLVAETKGTADISKLRPDEQAKVKCGSAHFELLKVPFRVVTSDHEIR